MRCRVGPWALLIVCGAAACSSKKAVPEGSGVLQHHNHASRDGVYIDPLFTKLAAATMTPDPVFAGTTYVGTVDAQPLYLDGVDGRPDLLFIATSQNQVLAFDAGTGAKAWEKALGPPGVRPATVCSPMSFGIFGTPIIDGATRTLYVDAYTAFDATTNKHLVFALDADTGQIRPSWPVDVDAKARSGTVVFDSDVQNQHGALALVAGRVLVPYGGFRGDCGDYRGWIVAINAADPSQVDAWATNSFKSGVWAPAGISSDGTSIYFATGNSNGALEPGWQGSEAVFRLKPTLERSDRTTDYYVPSNWLDLDRGDLDLGGSAPLPLDLPGATPSALLFQVGKDQKGRLLDRNNLGGISAPLVSLEANFEIPVTAPVVYTTSTGTYVAFTGRVPSRTGEAGVFKIGAGAPPTVALVWTILDQRTSSTPAVSMTDASGRDAMVWYASTGLGNFYVYDGDTGALISGVAPNTLPGLGKRQAPIIHKGRVFFAANDRVYVYVPAPRDAATD